MGWNQRFPSGCTSVVALGEEGLSTSSPPSDAGEPRSCVISSIRWDGLKTPLQRQGSKVIGAEG